MRPGPDQPQRLPVHPGALRRRDHRAAPPRPRPRGAQHDRHPEKRRRRPRASRPASVGSTVAGLRQPRGHRRARSRVTIDGIEIKVPVRHDHPRAAKTVGVDIPTLCHHPDLYVAGVCRVCVVEVEGQRTLQAACAYPDHQPDQGQHAHAQGAPGPPPRPRPAALRALRRVLHLRPQQQLRAADAGQGVRRRLASASAIPRTPQFDVDISSYSVMRDMDKCILCRRCVRTCIDLQEVGVLEAVGRSDETDDRDLRGQAAGRRRLHQLRPVHQPLPHRRALGQGRHRRGLGGHRRPDQARGHPDRPGAARGHRRGVRPGARHAGDLRDEHGAALRGFDRVFDTNFTADLTIIEEGTELILRLYKRAGERRRERRPAAVHELLAGLGQVHRALLSRVPAQRLARPRARSRCSARSSRPTTPRRSGSTRRTS